MKNEDSFEIRLGGRTGTSGFPLGQQRSNIIYVMTDQQTATAMRYAGNADLRTPNMDRLAECGMRLTNAYCSLLWSGLLRASMFTGHMPTEIGMAGTRYPCLTSCAVARWAR